MLKLCRNCVYWKSIPPWQGRCKLCLWKKPKWSETAEAGDCPSYTDRCETIYAQSAAK